MMQRYRLVRLLVVLALAACWGIEPCSAGETPPAPAPALAPDAGAQLVQSFVDAFNQRKLDSMMALATDSVEWLNLSGATVSTEAAGKEALTQSLKSYFASCPSCRSEITILGQSGPFLVAIERAIWESGGVTKSQESMSVYQLEKSLIQRVWYFPAVRPPSKESKNE